jgi:hypothetical protein
VTSKHDNFTEKEHGAEKQNKKQQTMTMGHLPTTS